MAERSFAREVESLRLGAGETFRGEGILAITKALLENGVGYVAGYQGAPISHLMDVFADAEDILAELGVRFEASANEAAAAATLAASVHYPIRGAVAFKSTVGTNVASDALANLASGGVTGGALVIVGEDYGEGSSIMQERSHAFAMKSQLWLLDPRPELAHIVAMVGHGFRLSEASATPVMLQVRIRSCHLLGEFIAADNLSPPMSMRDALESPRRRTDRIVLPPASFLHEQEKLQQRLPAALDYITAHNLNETFTGAANHQHIGVILQGGMYNGVIRALQRIGFANEQGDCQLPLYVLNVTYPLHDAELLAFCLGKRHVLVVEEGQPAYIEHYVRAVLQRAASEVRDLHTHPDAHLETQGSGANGMDESQAQQQTLAQQVQISGKGCLPEAGEYTPEVMLAGFTRFIDARTDVDLPPHARAPNQPAVIDVALLQATVPARPPGFCIGCPERPIFAATKLVENELGQHHIASDIGCHLFSINPPFDLGATTMGYGLGPASASAFNDRSASKRSLSFIGDGGFWHNGLTSSIGNAVFNQHDGVTVVVDNYYSAATGGQDLLSSRANNASKSTHHPIARAVSGVGVKQVRHIQRTYDVATMRDTLKAYLQAKNAGPKVVVASSECMLNRQRRERPILAAKLASGERVTRTRFGVDAAVCTGDHACMRLSGCPSLSLQHLDDPLRDDPVATIDQHCVGCGNCGEVADAAILCPSFYQADVIRNSTAIDQWASSWRTRWRGWLQQRRQHNYLQKVESNETNAYHTDAANNTTSPTLQQTSTVTHPATTPGDQTQSDDIAASASADDRSAARPALQQTLKIAVMAVGGQGGGVLSRWIADLASNAGLAAQMTSIAGVAQRTGATIYYLEIAPKQRPETANDAVTKATATPVFSLSPAAGDIDVLLSAELMEAGRAMLRGFITPDRTHVVTSAHRILSVAEKIIPGNGIADSTPVFEQLQDASHQLLCFDMQRIAEDHNSVISASLFGALAASNALPFDITAFEKILGSDTETSRQSARTRNTLAAFRAAYQHGQALRRAGQSIEPAALAPASSAQSGHAGYTPGVEVANHKSPVMRSLNKDLLAAWDRLQQQVHGLPTPVQAMANAGLAKVVDYQDCDYGREYLRRLQSFIEQDTAAAHYRLSIAAAKAIANAMCYDDIMRVADLKTRASRQPQIANTQQAQAGDVMHITDYLHPRAIELCATLPRRIGAWLHRQHARNGFLHKLLEWTFKRGKRVRTDAIFGFSMLWLVAGLRRWRRRFYRHTLELQHLDSLTETALEYAPQNYPLACEILGCQRLIKGYSDTHERSHSRFRQAIAAVPQLASGATDAATALAELRDGMLSSTETRAA